MDFSKLKKGDAVTVHCCDPCVIRSGFTPPTPADSGVKSWMCERCGHYGIGSLTNCVIGDWLTLNISMGKHCDQ